MLSIIFFNLSLLIFFIDSTSQSILIYLFPSIFLTFGFLSIFLKLLFLTDCQWATFQNFSFSNYLFDLFRLMTLLWFLFFDLCFQLLFDQFFQTEFPSIVSLEFFIFILSYDLILFHLLLITFLLNYLLLDLFHLIWLSWYTFFNFSTSAYNSQFLLFKILLNTLLSYLSAYSH